MTNLPRALVRIIGGQIVLEDPDAFEIVEAIEKINCRNTFAANLERVIHFKKRAGELGKSPGEVVIVVLNVDDAHGGAIAEKLMPGFSWQKIRDSGEIPFARGLADRQGIQEIIAIFDQQAAEKLREMKTLAVVVVDHGVAEIFKA